MKAQILKIAGVKSEKEFYKKFPSEEAFMKKHGKELEKAQNGISKKFNTDYTYKPLDMSLTGAMANNPYMNGSASNTAPTTKTANDKFDLAGFVSTYLPSVVGNVQDINQTNRDINNLSAYNEIGNAVAKAAKTRAEPVKKKYDYTATRSQTVNPMGVGTNYLQAENGAEIQNTYDPNTIYTDGGYEPLNDSNVKQFAFGGNANPSASGGFDASAFQGLAGNLGSAMGHGTGRGGNWAQLGSILGTASLAIPGIGPIADALIQTGLPLIGGLVDAGSQNKMQKAQDDMMSSFNSAVGSSAGQSIQSNYKSNLKDGGWVSNDWMPQVITKFGDYNMNELLAPPHDADMLRAGGHLREYTPPSARAMYTGRMDDGGTLPSTNMMFDTDRYPSAKYGTSMAMGGELKTTWGGIAEPISYNPYLPGTGETVLFRGQSHDETNGNGQSGIGVKYGDGGMVDDGTDAHVEVERMETGKEMIDPRTGEKTFLVSGNVKIPKSIAEMIGDPKAKGMKFKNYDIHLTKNEVKQNKIIDKATKAINDLDVATTFDKIALQSLEKMRDGADSTLKKIAQQKTIAADGQSAILDIADHFKIKPDELAKGKIVQDKEAMKKAMFGAKMETAQNGKLISPSSIGDISKKERAAMARANGIKNYTGTKAQNMKLASIVNQASSNPIMNPGQGVLANAPLPAFDMFKGISPFAANPVAANPAVSNIVDDSGYVPSNELVDARQFADPSAYAPIDMQQSKALAQENVSAKSNISNQENKGAGNDLLNTGLSTLRSLAPFMKQTSQRPLNPDQLLPAYMALSMNQLKPVQAQFYNPMLQAQPYRVSLQDQRNEVNAQARAAFKQSVGNPSAAAMIAANASDAINKINAEENRMNQAETMRAAETNRGEINEASRLNLAIGDKQMERQSMAESLTKQEALGAAKWFAEAAAENRKANNRQAVLENMYPAISFTKSGVAYKDPLYTTMFNMPDVGTGATSKEEITTPFNFLKGDETKKASKADKVVSRNGAIVKAIKGL